MSRFIKLLYILVGLVLIAFSLLATDILYIGYLPPWLDQEIVNTILIIGACCTLVIGLLSILVGSFTRRKRASLISKQDGGTVSISTKSLKNITYIAIESFHGVLEARVRIHIVHKNGQPVYSVKAWIGTTDDSALPGQHQIIRQRIADDLLKATGIGVYRIDLTFYTSAKMQATTQKGGQTNDNTNQ